MDFFTTLLGPQCQICGSAVELSPSVCRDCQNQMQSYHRDGRHTPYDLPEYMAAVCRYEGWAQEFVTSQKRQSHPRLVQWIATLLKQSCPRYWLKRTVVWVPPRPLSTLHLVESVVLELKYQGLNTVKKNPLSRGLITTQLWRKQKQRNRRQRRFASHSAFRCGPLPAELHGQDLLLIDDVTTTGATIEACITVLQEQGAGHVAALVFAATPLKIDSKSNKHRFRKEKRHPGVDTAGAF